jgi:hypothetical protein
MISWVILATRFGTIIGASFLAMFFRTLSCTSFIGFSSDPITISSWFISVKPVFIGTCASLTRLSTEFKNYSTIVWSDASKFCFSLYPIARSIFLVVEPECRVIEANGGIGGKKGWS